MLRWLRRIIVGFFAIVGFTTIILMTLVFWLGLNFVKPKPPVVREAVVLQLDLTKPLASAGLEGSFSGLLEGKQLSLRQIDAALERAGRDTRVKGLVVRLGDKSLGIATTQELRDAIAAFRKEGKFVIAFAESYGENGNGSGAYYLAVACDEIWLQPSGELELTGVVAETPFLKGTFHKLGISPRFDKRKEYKTAVDQLTEAAYTPAFKESMVSILGSLYDQLTKGIAEGRGMTVDAVKALVDRGPYLAKEALKEKLVDRLGYRDELREAAKRHAGVDAQFLSLRDYFRTTEDQASGGRVMAVIDGEGVIVSGESDLGTPFGAGQIGADTLVKALDEAAESRDVAAILLRLDSPGGSYLASDTIWRAVSRAKAAGKPVIVAMGNVAASGGYFVAAPATRIVAEPGTLTGSIGVFGGKFVLKELLDKLGVTMDSVQFGRNAGLWSAERDFTPEGWARLEASLDAVYQDFTSKVAAARGLDASRIPAVAKGRVFTGEEAKKIGLVDALGGFPAALRLAREAAGLKPEEPVRLRNYPRPSNELRRLFSEFINETHVEATLPETLFARLGTSAAALRPLIAELPALVQPGEAWLLMPPIAVY